MKLIVGLGNPGDKYKNTRHNVGFITVDRIATNFSFDKFKKITKHKAEIAEGYINGEKTLLVKPQTFMNLSGQSVQSLMSFYKIPIEDIIIIYDDVDINFGKIKIKIKGSAGGHNGIKSVISSIGENFVRIRLGIKPKIPFIGALEDYVLGRFTDDQINLFDEVLADISYVVMSVIVDGASEAMNKFN